MNLFGELLNFSDPISVLALFVELIGAAIALRAYQRGGAHPPSGREMIIVLSGVISLYVVFLGIRWSILFSPQNIYDRAIRGNLVLNDPLSTQDNNNWETNASFACVFEGSVYHAISSQPHDVTLCLAHATNFSNFAFQAQMMLLSGDAGGLAFCADERHFYRFTIHSNGFYELFVSENIQGESGKTLNQGRLSINAQQSNLLSVIVYDGHIYIYVNRQPVANVYDSTFSFGGIGVFSYDTMNPTDVAFRNAQVWEF
jgi:hypothetical protein